MPRNSSPSELYRHTQFGTLVVSALTITLLTTFFLGQLSGWPVPVLFVMGLMVGLLALFHSLTTIVTSQELRIAFGPGWIAKTIPLANIQGAEPGRSHLLWGWGVRYWPGRGWMWNVSGFDIVVLDLPDGQQFRVGTDDPEGLAGSIREARDALS